ncbi:MAG: deoxyribodipyrimidine photo-lyase, partial [Pseudomonadota bacterium]
MDHRALTCAAARGPVVPLYVVEPELWAQPEASGRHWDFLRESLTELRGDLAAAGQPLIIRVGEIRSVLAALKAETDFATLWSHEETGNRWSYERDLAVAEWCRSNRIDWREERQFGVIRRLKARDGWARRWDQFMTEPVEPAPTLTPVKAALPLGRLPARDSLGLASDACPERQRGGREAGLDRLYSFLEHRGTDYRSAMASPLAGAEACSRISPFLAFGCLSLREVTQHTWNRQRELKHQATALDRGTDAAQTVGRFRASLKSFNGRLHWHCHFMQKLEDEPALETRNLHRAYDGMRPTSPDTVRLAAWERGETGLPFVDACMRS